jgi:hypothetical protein
VGEFQHIDKALAESLEDTRPELVIRFVCKIRGKQTDLKIALGGEVVVALDALRFHEAQRLRHDISSC